MLAIHGQRHVVHDQRGVLAARPGVRSLAWHLLENLCQGDLGTKRRLPGLAGARPFDHGPDFLARVETLKRLQVAACPLALLRPVMSECVTRASSNTFIILPSTTHAMHRHGGGEVTRAIRPSPVYQPHRPWSGSPISSVA